jgi:SAM-dependent methyltransferase
MDEDDSIERWMEANRSTWDERAAIHMRNDSGFYALERFRAGEDVLLDIEGSEIGDVVQRHILHLQCHIGLDTLCLARRGGIVTGLDFSAGSIAAARQLSTELAIPAHFVQADVYDALSRLDGGFDIVFVNWGSLNWLPDIWRWGRIVAGLLAPGGFLYVADQHPFVSVMKEIDGRLAPAFPWRTPAGRPIVTEIATSYNEDQTPLVNRTAYEWEHSVSDIIGSLRAAGLVLDFFHEFDVLPWQRFPMMVKAQDRYFRLPPEQVPIPLAFSLKAYRPGSEIW